MVCYFPKQAIRSYIPNPSGNFSLKFLKKSNLLRVDKDGVSGRYYDNVTGQVAIAIPCGQCKGCRLDYSMKWAVRCLHERDMHEENSYITLTYASDFLPKDGSLCYEDYQLFVKRLRDRLNYKKFSFLVAGEYGDNFDRPHFHAVLFGHDFSDKLLYKRCDGYNLYQSDFLQDVWGKGFCTVGDVNFSSVAYVARYVFKKVNGDKKSEHYKGKLPEFLKTSKRPAIAKLWFDKFSDDLYSNDTDLYCNKSNEYVKVNVSRYFDKLLERVDPEEFARIKSLRGENSLKKRALTDYELSRLRDIAYSKINKLKRDFEEK